MRFNQLEFSATVYGLAEDSSYRNQLNPPRVEVLLDRSPFCGDPQRLSLTLWGCGNERLFLGEKEARELRDLLNLFLHNGDEEELRK